MKVLISGASIAGPVLAYWLSRNGFDVTVVERAPALRKTGGHAVDLSGLRLRNGQTITVLAGWKSDARLLKAVHGSACGTFGTVLGPKSDRFHQDHIHVDTAANRGGPYCR